MFFQYLCLYYRSLDPYVRTVMIRNDKISMSFYIVPSETEGEISEFILIYRKKDKNEKALVMRIVGQMTMQEMDSALQKQSN